MIDGKLDDAAWQTPPLKLGTWITYNPLFGEQMAQQTEVWVAYDKQYLYFAFRCLDPEPDKIKSAISRRDTQWNDDWVGLSLDSVGSHQSSYDMFVNPSGIQGDILNSSTAGESTAVDWVWDSAAKRTDRGYDVEIRLPLKSIRFRSGADVRMGMLFWRRVSRLGMSASWPSLPPGQVPLHPARARWCCDDLKAPLKLELMPNLTYSWNQERAAPRALGRGRLAARRGPHAEVRHHLLDDARRDLSPRLQPGGERRLPDRGQPAVSRSSTARSGRSSWKGWERSSWPARAATGT